MDDNKPQEDQEQAPSDELQAIENGYTDERPPVKHYSHFTPGQGSADSPAPTPLPALEVNPVTPPAHTSAGVIVLQWLTYAFWGWTLLAVIWLVYIVTANLIMGSDQTEVIPYAIASVIILLPISFVCDLFYTRKEAVKKTGAATVVMVIHAVIFALFGIGVLISAVFLLVGMFINDDFGEKLPITGIITLLISAVLYGITFLRTLNPSSSFRLGKPYRLVMLVFVGVFVVLAFAGPVAKSLNTRDDRALAVQLPEISNEIQAYVNKNGRLPAKLSDVELQLEAKELINKGLVEYKGEGRSMADFSANSDDVAYEHRYQLCATFVASNISYDSSYVSQSRNDQYDSYLSVAGHPAGETCYKLYATEYPGSISIKPSTS